LDQNIDLDVRVKAIVKESLDEVQIQMMMIGPHRNILHSIEVEKWKHDCSKEGATPVPLVVIREVGRIQGALSK